MTYFKYADMSEAIASVIDEIEKERDPKDRAVMLNSFMKATSQLLTSSMQRLAYELFLVGMATSDIASDIGMSHRAVKRLIAGRAKSLGVANPMVPEPVTSFIDIRTLVKN